MLKSIYIGNLEWKTTLDELKDFFAPYGQVTSAEIIKDRETGMAKGFGFVTMENADKAILELNGKEFRGRTVKINEAREREPRREYTPRQESAPSRDYPPPTRYPSRNEGYRDNPPPPPPRRESYPPRNDGYRESYAPRRDEGYRDAPRREYQDRGPARPEYRESNYNSRDYYEAPNRPRDYGRDKRRYSEDDHRRRDY